MVRNAAAFILMALCAVILICGNMGYAGSAMKGAKLKPTLPDESTPAGRVEYVPIVAPDLAGQSLSIGTYTTLSGFYDYQANGTPHHIRVNPANGNIHVTFMIGEDSINFNASRRSAYAFSSNNGLTWSNFNNVRVPSRRSGFPSIDLLQGANAGSPVIGNHSTITGTQSAVFVDSPEGSGAFSELNAPPLVAAGGDEPIWPLVAGTASGGLVMHSSASTANTNHVNVTNDFATWLFPAPWFRPSGPNGAGGRNPVVANSSGRVGTLVNATSGGLYLYESTDNGATWGNPVTVHPDIRVVGTDSFAVWVSVDLTYDGNTPLAALNTSTTDGAGGYFFADARIDFWSPSTGLVEAVPHDTALFVQDMNGFSQTNHLTLGGPTICKVGNTIVIVFQAFQRETAASGHRYSDVWYVSSSNNGVTWSRPVNLTNTPTVDERYPSVSKWNQPGVVNMVWQEDPYPGTWTVGNPDPGAIPGRARQVYYRLTLTDVEDRPYLASDFKLSQNYPNPFNPTTTIAYTLPGAASVELSVFNTLGQKVAVLANGFKEAGQYEVSFSPDRLGSGVYYYTLKAGGSSQTRKMILIK